MVLQMQLVENECPGLNSRGVTRTRSRLAFRENLLSNLKEKKNLNFSDLHHFEYPHRLTILLLLVVLYSSPL